QSSVRRTISHARTFPAIRHRPVIRLRASSTARRKEMLILRHISSRRCRRRTSARREAFSARTHRQSPGGETRILELRVGRRLRVHVPGAKLFARDGCPAAEVRVMHRQVHVRKARARAQRSKTAAIVFAEARIPEAATPTTPPRMEKVTRSKRQPSHRPESKTKSESKATEAKERNISRRPNRLIERIPVSRTRPPIPPSVDLHPPPIVIRSPAPRVIRNPRPSPIRFIHPAPVAIRSPTRRHRRPPHWTIVRNLRPRPMSIQVFRPHVVIVGLFPRQRIADHVIAILVPLIKVIASRSFANLVLLVRPRALNRNELVLPHARAALRSRNFDFTFANQHLSMIISRD